MNWTGGQLRRHSARPGALSKAQRHNFAKSRQTINGRSSQSTPFRGFPKELLKDDHGELAEANLIPELGEPRSPQGLLPNNTLGDLKRQLLEQPDWAAISVARPLEMTFASLEEVRQVGKRRKLTDVDRKRLSTNEDLTLPERFKSSKGKIPEDIDLDHVKVRIDGHLAGSHLDDTQGTINHSSSYSMLLGSESPAPFHPTQQGSSPTLSWKVAQGRLSLKPRHIAPCLEEPKTPSKTRAAQHVDPAGYDFLQAVTPKLNLPKSSPCQSQAETDRGTSLASFDGNAPGSPLPRRHFTIDDQLLAEQMRHRVPSESSQRLVAESSFSLRRTPSPSPTLIIADTSSDPMVSSWLPQPQRMLHPSSPLNTRSAFNHRLNVFQSPNEVPCSSLSSPSLPTKNLECPVSVKIFGQVVQMED
ncbi:hypothetical protein N7490_012037 [Penicillium lividum]|nr:hypothetical protein N7490_012037 [Penicillium lividum]